MRKVTSVVEVTPVDEETTEPSVPHLEIPAEPVELRDGLREALLNGGDWRAGFSDDICVGVWLWSIWQPTLEPGGCSREDFVDIVIANRRELSDATQVPFTTLMPAFITSEIKSAFTIGFLIYIPFVVIDLIVASVLMSMGMMMLSPMIISMPIKLMLFVLIDGWTLLMASLANSFVF